MEGNVLYELVSGLLYIVLFLKKLLPIVFGLNISLCSPFFPIILPHSQSPSQW